MGKLIKYHIVSNNLNPQRIKQLAEITKDYDLSHFASSISAFNIWRRIKNKKNLYIGKPFGCQSLFLLDFKTLAELNIYPTSVITNPEIYPYDFKHVDKTLGSVLSVAVTDPNANVFISDSFFNIGEFYEGLSYINNLIKVNPKFYENFNIYIDYNNFAMNELNLSLDEIVLRLKAFLPDNIESDYTRIHIYIYDSSKDKIKEIYSHNFKISQETKPDEIIKIIGDFKDKKIQ